MQDHEHERSGASHHGERHRDSAAHPAAGKRTLVEAAAQPAAGTRTLVEAAVQRRAEDPAPGGGAPDVHAAAAHGISGSASPLPYGDTIQRLFGRHDISNIQAHSDAPAAAGARAMGAQAFATGNHVAFGAAPDLHTAAHEAAHVVQQRAGVHPKGGVGDSGDAHERNADAVADRVVQGQSAEDLLPGAAPQVVAGAGAVQRKDPKPSDHPGAGSGEPLFSGHLQKMVEAEEFHQVSGKTLTSACRAALKTYLGKKFTAQKLETFCHNACNIVVLFFIAKAKELRSPENLQKEYPSYKQLVETLMTNFLLDALRDGRVQSDGKVPTRDGSGGRSPAVLSPTEDKNLIYLGSTPQTKAQKLLSFNGKLLRIRVRQWPPFDHFAVGEVKDGNLHTFDINMMPGRSGTYNLREYVNNGEKTPEGKRTHDYLIEHVKDARVAN